MDSFEGHKWVRVMCDYYADPVWNKNGLNADLDELPVSDRLAERLRAWADEFEMSPIEGEFPNLDEFINKGFEISLAVKAELPEWVVVYHDPHKYGNDVDPDIEITDSIVHSAIKPSPDAHVPNGL